MRNNQIFYNFSEEKDEILSFMEDKQKIEDARSNIKLNMAPRLGKKNTKKLGQQSQSLLITPIGRERENL